MIKEISLTGDVIGTSQYNAETGKTAISTIKKGCVIYDNGNGKGKCFKILEINIPLNTWNDVNILLQISNIFSSDGVEQDGLLKIHARPQSHLNIYSQWIYANSRINIAKYILAYKDSVIRLYYVSDNDYMGIRVALLDDITLGNVKPDINFFDTLNEEVPSDYTQIRKR